MLVEITRQGKVFEYHVPNYLDFGLWLKGYTLDNEWPIDYMRVLEWED